jgi:diguanylate cyclase
MRLNLSPRRLIGPREVVRLRWMLRRAGCDPCGITFEITETAVLRDLEAAVQQVSLTRELGIRVDLDDFGTGYSSMALLRQLPLDGIKIDRSFVRDVVADPHDATLVGAMVDLARRLGLGVVAEGVESVEQADVLSGLGCEKAQGYLWSRAVPFDELVALVSAQRQPSTAGR